MFDRFENPSPIVVAALNRFVERGPRELDFRNLEMIAAAESSFTDPNHIAFVIDRMPVTQMRLATAPVDRAQAEENFRSILPHFRPATSRKLLLDLLTTSTMTVVESCPPEIVPEKTKDLVRTDLLTKLKNNEISKSAVLRHDFVTSEMVTVVLDHLEAELIASSPDGVPDSGQLFAIGEVLVPRSLESVATDDQLLRVWNMIARSDPDTASNMVHIDVFYRAVKVPRLVAMASESMIEWANRSDSLNEVGFRPLFESPAIAETDARYITNQFHRYQGDLDRWGTVRQHHYRLTDELLPPMTSDELDIRVTQLPRQLLRDELIEEVRSPAALEILADRSGELDYQSVLALIKHEHVETHHLRRIIDRFSHADRGPEYVEGVIETVVKCRRAGDSLLDDLVQRVNDQPYEQFGYIHDHPMNDRILEFAALNQSAGALVFDRVLRRHAQLENRYPKTETSTLLQTVAANSASPHIQRAIADIAVRTRDTTLAGSLIGNGSVHVDLWRQLRSSFPDVSVELQPLSRSLFFGNGHEGDELHARNAGYSEKDVADLVASNEAPPDRVKWLVENRVTGIEVPDPTRPLLKAMDAGYSDEHIVGLTGDPDRHLALNVASRMPPTSEESRFRTPAESALSETALAVATEGVELPRDKGLRKWGQLPNRDSVPFGPRSFDQLLEDREVAGFVLKTPKSLRDVRDLSKHMRNCLDSYANSVAKGNHVLAHVRAEADTYAVMWRIEELSREDDVVGISADQVLPASAMSEMTSPKVCIRMVEINARFNSSVVPPALVRGIHELTEQINNGTIPFPSPAEVIESARAVQPAQHTDNSDVVELPEAHADNAAAVETTQHTDSAAVVGPQNARQPRVRRQAVPRLISHQNGDDQPARGSHENGTPSLLARPGEPDQSDPTPVVELEPEVSERPDQPRQDQPRQDGLDQGIG